MNKLISDNAMYGNWRNKSITYTDYNRIVHLIQDSMVKENGSPDVLHYLYLLTYTSKKYFSDEVPDDVITMNSKVILWIDDQGKQEIRIVYPAEIKSQTDRSVLSPIGAACLGGKEKSYTYFLDNNRVKRVYIERLVFQPEREKLYHI